MAATTSTLNMQAPNSNSASMPRLGHVFDPNNNPHILHVHQNERDPPRPRHRYEMIDNPIHNLWRWQAWKDVELTEGEEGFGLTPLSTSLYDQDGNEISRKVYDRMQPALRLAMLKHGTGDQEFSFDMSWNPRPEDYDYLDAELEHFANEYRIFPIAPQSMANTSIFKYGVTCCARNTDADHYEFATKYPVVTGVALETLQEFSDERWDRTLIHELAHALFYRRKYLQNMFTNHEDFKWWVGWEPHVNLNHPNELGHSASLWIYGCDLSFPWGDFRSVTDDAQYVVNPPDRPMVDGSQGVVAVGNFDGSDTEYYKVSKRTLKWLFDRRTWSTNRPIDLHLIGPFHRPPLDATIIQALATNIDLNIGVNTNPSNHPITGSMFDFIIDPSLDPTFDFSTDTNIEPAFDFNIDPNLDPNIDFSFDPNADMDVDPTFVPIIKANTRRNIDPNIDPNLVDLPSGYHPPDFLHPGLNSGNTAFTFT